MDHHEDRRRILRSLALAGLMLALMWLIHGVFHLMHWEEGKRLLANVPGRFTGLLGILTSPWIHDDLAHLVGNSGPLFFFVAAVLYYHPKSALLAMASIWLLTGLWVWIVAPGVPIIGASGVVYGLGAFLFFSGIFKRDRRGLILSLVIAIFYGSMIVGVFPGKTGVSWQSHLFGAIAGLTMAWGFRKLDVSPRKRYRWQDEPDYDPRDDHADWNYRQNWPGSNSFYIPGESNPPDQSVESPGH